MDTAQTTTIGTRPTGSCAPDGRNRWASHSLIDGQHKYTTYNGWLIEDETTTTDPVLASIIELVLEGRYVK